jgi:hypothetical protein
MKHIHVYDRWLHVRYVCIHQGAVREIETLLTLTLEKASTTCLHVLMSRAVVLVAACIDMAFAFC